MKRLDPRQIDPGTDVQVLTTVGGETVWADPSGAAPLAFHFAAPAATWTLIHNRGSYPPVVLFTDADGDEPVWTDVSYPDVNTTVVEWPSPTTGSAYIQ